jgi:cytochrome c oxidase assembly factor CtaG
VTATALLAVSSVPAPSGPYAFHPHIAPWLAIVAVAGAYAVLVRRAVRAGRPGAVPTRRQLWYLAGGLVALVLALTWPLADLAAHWSLTALLVQRLLLILVATPLLLLALPAAVIADLTRPAPVDRALEWLTRPVVAVVVFTVIAVGTLLTPVVAAQASSVIVRGVVDAVLLFGAAVLWGPVLRHIPGASRPSTIGLAAYLFVQSIVPGFPSVIYVFARHPLYPVFAHAHAAIGLSPVADQQLAGVTAKVATLPVLWTVAWVALARAAREDKEGLDTAVLTWAEVERQLERAERLEKRGPARRHAGRVFPRPRVGSPPGTDEPGIRLPPPAADPPPSPENN